MNPAEGNSQAKPSQARIGAKVTQADAVQRATCGTPLPGAASQFSQQATINNPPSYDTCGTTTDRERGERDRKRKRVILLGKESEREGESKREIARLH